MIIIGKSKIFPSLAMTDCLAANHRLLGTEELVMVPVRLKKGTETKPIDGV